MVQWVAVRVAVGVAAFLGGAALILALLACEGAVAVWVVLGR